MKRRELLISALALPFLVGAPLAQAHSPKLVRVTFPLIFQPGDGFSIIGNKLKMAVNAVLAANPKLSPHLDRQVSFWMLQADGRPWGSPTPVKIIAPAVFKKSGSWNAPRNAIMAKSLRMQLHSDAPNIDKLARVVVKAHFHVA